MHRLARIALALVLTAHGASPAFAVGLIAAGAGQGGGPHVVIYADLDNNKTYETVTDSFFAFPPTSPNGPLFTGGVRVAMGDFDGDGNAELVTAMGPGSSRVRIWRLTGGGKVAQLLDEFDAYPGFNGGVWIATGDID